MRTVKKLSDNSVVSTENFNYDAAGNVTSAPDSSFQYDTNNRLISFNGNTVSYDLDGNMLSNGSLTCTYDSTNRLVSAGGYTYTYNAEDVRIRNLCEDQDTTYTYDTNCRLSKLLCKTTNGITTKYVYGRGLIGEETVNVFKTYHFDCRGSTIAITDASGSITDTFAYDTYGKLLSRTGTSKVIFGYNGRDGVVTDDNSLIYMRARYYSPDMRRFINADIIAGEISNAITLNRYAYANGNPVSYIDPFGLAAARDQSISYDFLRNGIYNPLFDRYAYVHKNLKFEATVSDSTSEDATQIVSLEDLAHFRRSLSTLNPPKKPISAQVIKRISNQPSKPSIWETIWKDYIVSSWKGITQVCMSIYDSLEFELSAGTGIGVNVEAANVGIEAYYREAGYTVKKDAGEDIFLGSITESKFNIDAVTGEFPSGSIEYYDMDGNLIEKEYHHPDLKDSITLLDVGGYFFFGGKISISFNLDHFLTNLIWG